MDGHGGDWSRGWVVWPISSERIRRQHDRGTKPHLAGTYLSQRSQMGCFATICLTVTTLET